MSRPVYRDRSLHIVTQLDVLLGHQIGNLLHRLSSSVGSDFHLWDVKLGIFHIFTGHIYYACSVEFWPDGKYVVSGSNDETIRVWDSKTGVTVAGQCVGHTDWMQSRPILVEGMLFQPLWTRPSDNGHGMPWNV